MTQAVIFKPVEEILTPSIGSQILVLISSDGTQRQATIEDFHARIAEAELNQRVPDEVRSIFETAKNVLLYSWYAHEMCMSAKLTALIAIEYALRYKATQKGIERVGPKKGRPVKKAMLKELFELAIAREWVYNSDFARFHDNKSENYLETIKGSIIDFRNDLAHGTTTLLQHTTVAWFFSVYACLINVLFPNEANK